MPTALVTGASSGIGAAFARRLAKDGYSLILVARNESRLRDAAPRLRAAGAPAVEVLAADLADSAGRAAVRARLEATDSARAVDVLINNAGMGLGKSFLGSSPEELRVLLDVNVTAVMELTHAALPGMIARGRGGIVNISSIAGMLPGRGSTYGASKAWVTAFTEGVALTARRRGVAMVAVCPGFVRTEFHERANMDMTGKPRWVYVPMDTVVRQSLAALWSGRTVVVPGPLYKLVALAARLAPRALIRRAALRF